MRKWIALLLMAHGILLHADQTFLNEHEEGWFWHNEKVEIEKKEPEPVKDIVKEKLADPEKTWKLIGKMVERTRARAILNPTPQNIAEARRVQRLVVSQANLFSERWMFDLLLNPEQDESLINPSNSSARDIYNQQNSILKEQAIQKISQTSGLIYFYAGGDPFSERMAEVVRDFTSRYKMPLMPVAVTRELSPVFPNSRIDQRLAEQMGVKHIPAVFALNPTSQKPMPVAYGLISQSELKEHILMAINEYQPGEQYEN